MGCQEGAEKENAEEAEVAEVSQRIRSGREGFERGAGGVLAGGAKLLGECVRDVEDHLHGERVAGLSGVGGNIVGMLP